MNRTYDVLEKAGARARDYLQKLGERSVYPSEEALEKLEQIGGTIPENPSDPGEVIDLLDRIGSPATVATAGPRYFGYVIGGALPVTVAANWLAGAWDQNAPVSFLSPIGTSCENTAIEWLVDLLGLPAGTWGGLTSGATMANFHGLAAARYALLKKQGWDLTAQGMFNAPEIKIVVSEEVHVSALVALRNLGFGKDHFTWVPTDEQGKMRADALPELDPLTIVCIQAGNVNSGAFDPATEICQQAHEAGAWVHVDGAFGLWAAVTPSRKHLTEGVSEADSWATDCHKWLNVPYDCGVVFCREPKYLASAMALDPAGYLDKEFTEKSPDHFTMPMSRRARGVEVWAALRMLGRSGLAEMIEGCCEHAKSFAARLSEAGYEVLNDVVLNQAMVSFGDDSETQRVMEGVQKEGTCYMSGTAWHGRKAMRISVSSWATAAEDVEKSVEAILKVARS